MTRYYVTFTDGQGIHRETGVSRPVYLELLRFIRTERNLRRWDERHIEQSEMSDEMLGAFAINPQKTIEETTFDSLRNEQLRQAVLQLSEVQRRRFVLYHEFGFTYEQIADIEGCSFQAVAKAIKSAEATIRKYF